VQEVADSLATPTGSRPFPCVYVCVQEVADGLATPTGSGKHWQGLHALLKCHPRQLFHPDLSYEALATIQTLQVCALKKIICPEGERTDFKWAWV